MNQFIQVKMSQFKENMKSYFFLFIDIKSLKEVGEWLIVEMTEEAIYSLKGFLWGDIHPIGMVEFH